MINDINKLKIKKIIIIYSLKDPENIIKKKLHIVFEIDNKSPEYSKHVFESGGPSILVEFITNIKDDPRLYGILSLGFISAYSSELAMSIIRAKAIK